MRYAGIIGTAMAQRGKHHIAVGYEFRSEKTPPIPHISRQGLAYDRGVEYSY